jgi:hypothetical protein
VNNDRYRLDLMQTEISATAASMFDDDGKKINVKALKKEVKDLTKRVEDLEKKDKTTKETP